MSNREIRNEKGLPEQAKYVRSGIRATEVDESEMQQAIRSDCFGGMVFAGRIPTPSYMIIHDRALKYGLPDIRGYYGYDFASHEFISLPESHEGPPDEWPSRELADIVPVLRDLPKT